MDTVRISHCTLLVLLCCQYGVSYRIYILPEPGAFCLGVFSGDDCFTWSEYSTRPTFVDHSTTLIFTPGIYSSSGLSRNYHNMLYVANIKRFAMIGDGAQLQFQLSLSNIGEVRIHNLSFTNSPMIDVRNVQSFVMENCTLSQTSSSLGMSFYNSNVNQIIKSTFNKVIINVQSHSTLLVDRSTFINSSSATFITGDIYSNVKINSSRFLNNFATNNGIVYTRGLLTIINCLFDRNSVQSSNGAVVYSAGNAIVIGSIFTNNTASYVANPYNRPVHYTYYRGGSAVRGEDNINISNCTFSFYTQSSSVIYSYQYNVRRGGYRVYIANSKFYHSTQSIYSYNDVTLVNSSFYNITGSGVGVVYSAKNITTINCKFINSATVNGNSGIVHSQQSQSLLNSLFISSSAKYGASSKAVYSQQGNITVTNCTISDSMASGDGGAVYTTQNVTIINTSIINSASQYGSGGAVYGLNVGVTNSSFQNTRASMNGGAVYAVQNFITVNSKFSNSTVNTGSGGTIYSGNDMKAINCTITESSTSVGNGGALYSGNDVTAINCTISECSALNGKGGAVYSAASQSNALSNMNLVFSKSTFEDNYATSGGVLYTTGHYNHRMEFINCAFSFNNATRGGVAHVENSYLFITNSAFSDNKADTDGGVMDLSLSSVRIQHSLLSQNSAGGNGGVFYTQRYSTNFTISYTIIDHNSAENGGVFYVRRSNSNIRVIDSKFICNSASNQSGVMDIRGVTLRMDMDTVIANNTAGIGEVISACVSQITAYGLESRLDPVYPQYCTIYDERNSSSPMYQSITTDTIPVTEHTSEGHTDGTGLLVTTTPERDITTTEEVATTIPSTSQSSSAAITSMSDTAGTTHTHKVTTSSLSSTTPHQFTTYTERTTDLIASTRMQSNTDESTIVSEEVTTAATVTQTSTSSSSISHTSNGGREGSATTSPDLTNQSKITTSTATSASQTDSPLYSSGSIVTTTEMVSGPSSGDLLVTTVTELQAKQDKYDIWESSQRNLLQVAIISLTMLFIVCIAVCIMMVILFIMACKRRYKVQITRGRYRKLSPIEIDQEETHKENETQEYSFMEI